MSVAVASDKSVVYGFEGRAGVFRCSGDDASAPVPLLPNYGGVAADPTSTRWAATQPPNQIYGYDGNELLKSSGCRRTRASTAAACSPSDRPAVCASPCGTATRPTATFGC